jgi:hypothetical protein
MNYKEKISGTILISFFVVIYFISDNNKKTKKNSIEENKKMSIGKVYKFEKSKSFQFYDFTYFYDGIKYKNAKDAKRMGGNSLVGRYFRIELSTKEPKYSNIFLDQEVTDSTEIVKAGFTLGESKAPAIRRVLMNRYICRITM